MIILKNERSELFQWDIGQGIVLLNETLPTEVHFQNINSTQALVVELVGNEAPIPNILLQEPFPIEVYFFYRNNNESHSIKRKTLSVRPRVRPADYVYTETEVFTYAGILEIAQRAAEDAADAKADAATAVAATAVAGASGSVAAHNGDVSAHTEKFADYVTFDYLAMWELDNQADWNENDTSNHGYILNKPTIPTTTSELANNSGYATESYVASAIATAITGAIEEDY